jgi:general secretion pathway protein G
VGKSEVQVARAQIESLDKALDQFRLDMRRYPSAEEGLEALVAKPGNAAGWNGPYLKKSLPSDPWGRAYVYRASAPFLLQHPVGRRRRQRLPRNA